MIQCDKNLNIFDEMSQCVYTTKNMIEMTRLIHSIPQWIFREERGGREAKNKNTNENEF